MKIAWDDAQDIARLMVYHHNLSVAIRVGDFQIYAGGNNNGRQAINILPSAANQKIIHQECMLELRRIENELKNLGVDISGREQA